MNWTENQLALTKQFVFSNFNQAMEFVNGVATLAEEVNHHPDIHLHQYRKVTISLTTHDEGKVTEKDWQLAERIDQLYYLNKATS